ncbi:MAG: virulence protein RhuM/Fic/DOC family protein, partial [Candidatus Cloacimonadota bacterium]|nr:virulence protein RhuM/Fic/DOC family protein [Candidatus Cloacimonadota bacterium]
QTKIEVRFEKDTVWLTQIQILELFESSKANISEHIKNIYQSNELSKEATVRKFRTVQKEGSRTVSRDRKHYNLDMIISIGYRVNSKRGIQFRQWATQRLKDFLMKGYAINEKRLEQKKQEVIHLKTGIQILSRAIKEKTEFKNNEILSIFAKGLELLDNYDHEKLDTKGKTEQVTIFPSYQNYIGFISEMYSDYESSVFAKPKDESFKSSINQIKQTFAGKELYPSIQEKAANLLYFIVKNHSFVDGNKRIAAACFLYFLDKNQILFGTNNKTIINNNTLASLTLFIATSKSNEADIVKQLVISILNEDDEIMK